MTLPELRKRFDSVIDRVTRDGERVLVERRGKAIAAIVPIEDLAMIEHFEDRADAKAAKAAIRAGGQPIPWEQARNKLGLSRRAIGRRRRRAQRRTQGSS